MIINSFVSAREDSLVFSQGTYAVGRSIPTGEYFLWGKQIAYNGVRRGELEFQETAKDEKYDMLPAGIDIEIISGFMTPVFNLTTTSDIKYPLELQHLYKVGLEIKKGTYLLCPSSKNQESHSYSIELYKPLEEYSSNIISCKGNIDTIYLDDNIGFLKVFAGNVFFAGDAKVTIDEMLKNIAIEPNKHVDSGIKAHEFSSADIMLYKWIPCNYYLSNDKYSSFSITNQFFFSVNGRMYWSGLFSPISFREDQPLYGFLSFRGNSTEDMFRVPIPYVPKERRKDPVWGSTNYIIVPLNNRIDDSDYSLVEVVFDDVKEPFSIGDAKERKESPLLSVLQERINKIDEVTIEVNEELPWIRYENQAISLCCEFFSWLFMEKSKVHFAPVSPEEEVTLIVPIIYDKAFYTIAKIADKALRVEEDKKKHQFLVTFSSNQIEEIAIVRYLLNTSKSQSMYQEMVDEKTLKILEKSCPVYWIEKKCRNDLWSENNTLYRNPAAKALVAYYANRIVHIWRQKADEYFSLIAKEKRIKSKWTSEYNLYSIISDFVEDAVFQYHPVWLNGQSYDIFIPSQNVAIEYQGIQHYSPVEVFGGNEGLKDNQRRDLRKRELSTEHEVRLLEWRYTEKVDHETVLKFLKSNDILYNNVVNNERRIALKTPGLLMAPYAMKDKG